MDPNNKKKSLSEAFAPMSNKKAKFIAESPQKQTLAVSPLSTPEKRTSNSNFSPNGQRSANILSPYNPKKHVDESTSSNRSLDRYVNGTKECTFNDPIHGNIAMKGLCLRIIDTKQFQRLRYLKQLGTCDFVYPGATHTRFSHSVGVAHYAELLVLNIKKNQPYLNITDNDILCVKVAGLCHDLGHGPFSHVFDGVFMARIYPDQHFHHEDWSVDMVRHLLKANHIHMEDYGLSALDQLFIEEIIRGTDENDRRGRPFEKFYLYDIVNNSRSGLDVDKLDYFRRDIRYTNVDVNSSDFQRFFENARVLRAQPIPGSNHPQQHSPPVAQKVNVSFASPPLFSFIHAASSNESMPIKGSTKETTPPIAAKISYTHPYMICFPEKMINDSINLFALRYQLHQKVYTHKSVKKVEYMLVDALAKADPYIKIRGTVTEGHPDGLYKISECIEDPAAMTLLDDRILCSIETDPRPELAEAQRILNRIASRDFYACMGKAIYNREQTPHKYKIQEIKEQIVEIANQILHQQSTIHLFEKKHYSIDEGDDHKVGIAESEDLSEANDDDDLFDAPQPPEPTGEFELIDDMMIQSQDSYAPWLHASYPPPYPASQQPRNSQSQNSAEDFFSPTRSREHPSASKHRSSTKKPIMSVITSIEEDDIIVEKMHIHYGMKNENPVDRLRFFPKDYTYEKTIAYCMNEKQYHTLLPRVFEELAVRVFCRDVRKSNIINTAFQTWCKQYTNTTPFPIPSQSQL